jgi:SAM-dependent methyltransferase
MMMNLLSLFRDHGQLEQSACDCEDEHLEQELRNITNHPAPSYGEPTYWNRRYAAEPDPFEWYQPWSRLRPIILPVLNGRGVALDLGCGNSGMPAELLVDGFDEVTGFDISSVVIQENERRFQSEPRLRWVCGECTNMDQLATASFDVVFDKGTMDSLMSARPSATIIARMMAEVVRVLKPGGLFVEISHGTPDTRQPLLSHPEYGWTVLENQQVEKPTAKGTFHYIYFAVKNCE